MSWTLCTSWSSAAALRSGPSCGRHPRILLSYGRFWGIGRAHSQAVDVKGAPREVRNTRQYRWLLTRSETINCWLCILRPPYFKIMSLILPPGIIGSTRISLSMRQCINAGPSHWYAFSRHVILLNCLGVEACCTKSFCKLYIVCLTLEEVCEYRPSKNSFCHCLTIPRALLSSITITMGSLLDTAVASSFMFI